MISINDLPIFVLKGYDADGKMIIQRIPPPNGEAALTRALERARELEP